MPYIITRPKNREKTITYEEILLDLISESDLAEYYNKNQFTTITRTNHLSHINMTQALRHNLSNSIGLLLNFYNANREIIEELHENQNAYNYKKQLSIRKQLEREYMINDKSTENEEFVAELKNKLDEKGIKYNPFYYTFYLPKRSGRGYRQIDAPQGPLKIAQQGLKATFEAMMNYNTYHTSAYAYIPHRSRVDLVKKLQKAKTRWILHLDFEDFFGSIDIDFTLQQLLQIYPFSEMNFDEIQILKKCLQLCFLDGRLPQGTPISPLLTNIIMIPLDYKINKALVENAMNITTFDNPIAGQNYNLTYTRYADDIYIGAHRGFKYQPVVRTIERIVAEEKAPLKIKAEKTKYKSINGENWILGLMYNQDQEITVGHKRKKQTQAMLANFAMDYTNGHLDEWDINDIQVTMGHAQYINQIEPDYFAKMIDKYKAKFGFDIMEKMKEAIYGN